MFMSTSILTSMIPNCHVLCTLAILKNIIMTVSTYQIVGAKLLPCDYYSMDEWGLQVGMEIFLVIST